MSYNKNKHRPQQQCFLSDQNFLKQPKRDRLKKHSSQIIMKSNELFWRRRFFKIRYICHIVKVSPAHGGHDFCRIKFFSRNLK